MATGKPSDEQVKEMVKFLKESKEYKILTKEEYEKLLSLSSGKEQATTGATSVVTSTPSVAQATDGARPKYGITSPGMSPVPRLQLLSNMSMGQNASYLAQPFNVPKLPFFSGSEQPQKNEVAYEVWSLEVKCLQNAQQANNLQEHIVLQAIRNSLKGSARSLLVPLGENASVTDILNKLDGFYGNVSSSETLIQSFYSDFQKEGESIVEYGSRLEQVLSRAVRCGHIDLVAKDAMLRSKFWTGLKSQQLKNSTRHLYDSIKDFQQLLREIRKVEQEDASSSRPPAKPKVAQQQTGQTLTESDSNTNKLLQQMTELMSRMKTLEQKLESQQSTSNNSQASVPQNTFRQQFSRGRGRGYRGSWRGNFGRGYQNYQNNNRGGGSSGGQQVGTSGRGANHGAGHGNKTNSPLN